MDILIVSCILLGALILFVSELFPVALTAIGIMVALMLSQILTPQDAVAGLAHPAVVTVGSMLLISKGLVRTGSVEYLARRMITLTKGNPKLAILSVLLMVAFASAHTAQGAIPAWIADRPPWSMQR